MRSSKDISVITFNCSAGCNIFGKGGAELCWRGQDGVGYTAIGRMSCHNSDRFQKSICVRCSQEGSAILAVAPRREHTSAHRKVFHRFSFPCIWSWKVLVGPALGDGFGSFIFCTCLMPADFGIQKNTASRHFCTAGSCNRDILAQTIPHRIRRPPGETRAFQAFPYLKEICI